MGALQMRQPFLSGAVGWGSGDFRSREVGFDARVDIADAGSEGGGSKD